MKVKVLKKFRDKRNGKIYKPGTFIEITKERLEEINETDTTLVKVVEADEKPDEPASKEVTKKKKNKSE